MQTQPRPIQPSLLGRRILVVEDHADSRELLATSFRLVGARVLAVGSLGDAQRSFDRVTPELVAIGFDAYLRKAVDLAKLCNVASALIGRAQP